MLNFHTFASAKAFIMPFGKYKGQALDKIAESDDGLRYLDWLRGQRDGTEDRVDKALAAYLDDPTIAEAVRELARGH